MLRLSLVAAFAVAAHATTLVSFAPGAEKGTAHKFTQLFDPVMGGRSNGTWHVADGVGVLDANVNIVPSLKAPGFVEVWADDGGYADASATAEGDLVLTVRSDTPEYAGFKVSFASGSLSPNFSCAAGGSIVGSRGCFKAPFTVPATKAGEFATVRVPFKAFTDEWSSATGKPTKTCEQDKSACVTASKLRKMQAIGIWGEGVEGHVHLEIKAVSAEPKKSLLRGSRPVAPVVVAVDALSEELEAQLAPPAKQSHLYFYWVNKAADRCGEVDAAPWMPKDLFEPSHKLRLLAYVEATISLYGIQSGPQPGDLKLGRCKDHGFAVDGHQVIGETWTPMDLQGPICMKHCKCQWWDTHGNPVSGYKPAAAAGLHKCTDVRDDPATGHFCSLCGPSAPGNCDGGGGACSIGIAMWHP